MKQITQEELDQVLQHHKLWLSSGGVKGRCANLKGTDLRGCNLHGVNLCRANLQGADLQGADLQDADLHFSNFRDANLQGANLENAYFHGADLRRTWFDVNIRDCSCFLRAKFTPDALPWLILHPRWPEWRGRVQIEAVEVR